MGRGGEHELRRLPGLRAEDPPSSAGARPPRPRSATICLVLAEMPIDPALAALTDAGDIESFQGTWLETAADKLEGK